MANIEKLLRENSGIRLDIGCGEQKQPGFIGMDSQKLPGVDIVHNMEKLPWPLPDESVVTAVAHHVLEHIDPAQGKFIKVMDELWRVMKPGGQFAFVTPYAGSVGYWQDPTHCNGITEVTVYYFCPEEEYTNGKLYSFYRPKPWKISMLSYNVQGVIECVLVKIPDKKEYHAKAK